MSDTPRTDRVIKNCNGWHHVPIEAARELERELAAVTKERDIEIERAWHYRDKWQDALARIKRLEEAGDAMAKDFSHFWTDRASVRDWPQAKEAR
jgi:hypothetical protein